MIFKIGFENALFLHFLFTGDTIGINYQLFGQRYNGERRCYTIIRKYTLNGLVGDGDWRARFLHFFNVNNLLASRNDRRGGCSVVQVKCYGDEGKSNVVPVLCLVLTWVVATPAVNR